MDEKENKNIFRIVNGGATEEAKEPEAPMNTYVLIDRNGNEFEYEGFLVFTTQHVAVMREQDQGAIPVAVMPLDQLYLAEIVESDVTQDLPF